MLESAREERSKEKEGKREIEREERVVGIIYGKMYDDLA